MKRKQVMRTMTLVGIAMLASGVPQIACAAGAPWETPMQTALNYLTGTTGAIVAALAVCATAAAYYMGKMGFDGFVKLLFCLGIVFGSVQVVAIFHS